MACSAADTELDIGDALTWDAKETNRSRKLIGSLGLGGWADRAAWPEVIEATVEMMIRFDAAIRSHPGKAVKAASAANSPSVQRFRSGHESRR